jgi:hypothetical protein
MTLENAMAATRRQHGKKTSAGHAASHRAALAARATVSTGNSRLLKLWRYRCEMYGHTTNSLTLIKFLAKDKRVVMDKNDSVIVLVAMLSCYSIKVLIERANKLRI